MNKPKHQHTFYCSPEEGKEVMDRLRKNPDKSITVRTFDPFFREYDLDRKDAVFDHKGKLALEVQTPFDITATLVAENRGMLQLVVFETISMADGVSIDSYRLVRGREIKLLFLVPSGSCFLRFEI